MKILVIGGDNGGGSAGDEFMCEAALNYFKTNIPGVELYTDAQNVDWIPEIADVNVVKQLRKDDADHYIYKLFKVPLKLFRVITFPFFSRFNRSVPLYFHGNDLRKIIQKVDIVFFAGCGGLSDKYPINIITWHSIIKAAKKNGKKVFISGTGIGPVNNKFNKYLITKIINSVDYISVRDKLYSLNFLEENIAHNNYDWVPDDAFFYFPDNKFNVDIEPNSIGINMMATLFKSEKDLLNFSERIDRISISLNCTIYLLAVTHEDIAVLKKIHANLKKSKLLPLLKPSQTKLVISKFKFFITARYHGCVFAASNKIPTISIYKEQYWENKNKGVFDMLNVEDNVFSISSFINNFNDDFYIDILQRNTFYPDNCIEKIKHKSYKAHKKVKKHYEENIVG